MASRLRRGGMMTFVVAIVPLLIVAGGIPLDRTGGAALWLACIWFVFAWHGRQHIWFAAGQLMLTVAMLFGLFFILDRYVDLSRSRSLDWQAAGLALAALSFGWTVARALLPGSSRWQELLRAVPRTVDQIVFLFALVAQLAFIAVALAPHLARELQLGQPALLQFSQARAWLLLILLAATLTLRLWQAHLTETLLGWM